jgi:hypothetical protein
METSALEVVDVDRERMPKAPTIVRPMIIGEARPTGHV